jgi:hypothetical protein
MKIHLHIDRLVLDGIAIERAHAGKVRAAVEHELTRLMASGGTVESLRQGGAVPYLRGGNIRISKENQPATLGRQIATAVHSGFKRRAR